MNIEKDILEKFELVNRAFFEKEGNLNFLRIEVNLKDLDEITNYSRKINEYLDENDKSQDQYYLDIYSSGTEIEVDKKDLDKYIGSNIFVKLKENIKDKNSFEGELIEDSKEEILVRWNAKGQFRKQIINKENIERVNLSAKVRKMKKEKKVRNEKRRI